MPRASRRHPEVNLKRMIEEAEQKQEETGFLKSYREFLDRWGSYRTSHGSRQGKPRNRTKQPTFKTMFSK